MPAGVNPVDALTVGVPVVLGIFALVALAAGVVGFFRSSLSKATIETQGTYIDALQERLDGLKVDLDDLHQSLATTLAAKGALDRENAVLREALSGKADAAALTLLIEEHHVAAIDGLKALSVGQSDIKAMLHDRRNRD